VYRLRQKAALQIKKLRGAEAICLIAERISRVARAHLFWRDALSRGEAHYFLDQRDVAPPTEESKTMTGIELLLMPLFTMGSMIALAISQIRSGGSR
jgi:hypothetical protein